MDSNDDINELLVGERKRLPGQCRNDIRRNPFMERRLRISIRSADI